MSDDVHNIHDAFSREVFSDPDRAAAFFEQFLPGALLEVLDMASLQVSKESYTTKTLKEYFSDLLFTIQLKKPSVAKVHIALLFEHKSEPDSNVLIQVGHYMFFHWMKCIRKKKAIYPIIPLIYYQGKIRWEIPELKSLFNKFPKSVTSYLPSVPHIFLPLNGLSEERIMDIRNAMMISALLAQKSKIRPIQLAEDFLKILALFPIESGDRNFFETITVYAYNVSNIDDDQMKQVIQQLPQPVKQDFMTTYEMIKNKGKLEGKQEGKLEGKLEGEITGKSVVVLNLHDAGMDIGFIMKVTELDRETVEKIIRERGSKKD